MNVGKLWQFDKEYFLSVRSDKHTVCIGKFEQVDWQFCIYNLVLSITFL